MPRMGCGVWRLLPIIYQGIVHNITYYIFSVKYSFNLQYSLENENFLKQLEKVKTFSVNNDLLWLGRKFVHMLNEIIVELILN